MSRITKCICDGCGKEIKATPVVFFAERVDAETGDLRQEGPGEFYWTPGDDYCEECANQIINFTKGLPARNAGKPGVPTPKLEREFPTLNEKAERKVIEGGGQSSAGEKKADNQGTSGSGKDAR